LPAAPLPHLLFSLNLLYKPADKRLDRLTLTRRSATKPMSESDLLDDLQSPIVASPLPIPAAHEHYPITECYLGIGDQKLIPLTIDSKAVFDRYVNSADSLLADFSFSNNFIWMTRMSGFYQIFNDCFCLFSLNGDHLTMLLPPIGEPENQRQALAHCFDLMDFYNHRRRWSKVEYVSAHFAQLLEGDAQWLLEKLPPDYIYNTTDLIELKGNAYKSKRGEINQFLRLFPEHRLEPMRADHHDGIRDLLNTWLRDRLQPLSGTTLANFLASAELERQGIERMLEHFDALHLSGLCLIVNDKLEGFTFGERINADMASILFEKTNFSIPAAAQYLFREFCRSLADCRYINAGDDMGLENLQRVKMSYRPVMFGERYALRRVRY